MVFTSVVCLVRVHFWNSLPSLFGPSAVLCRSQVVTQLTALFDNYLPSVLPSYEFYQLSEETRQAIITLSTLIEDQLVQKIAKTPKCSHKNQCYDKTDSHEGCPKAKVQLVSSRAYGRQFVTFPPIVPCS